MKQLISLYNNIKQTKGSKNLPFEAFIEGVQNGTWLDYVINVRRHKDKKLRKELKAEAPNVTISGTFETRKDSAIIKHSGLIAIDIDDVDANEIKAKLNEDPYVLATFISIGGSGVCAVFKIDGRQHRNCFYSISEYLLKKYEIITDPTAVNKSRTRFVSYDPEAYYNPYANKFDLIIKPKKTKTPPSVVFVEDDFEQIVRQIEERSIDLTETYDRWLRIGFALAEQFGENGRSYFHRISWFYSNYKEQLADRQYTNCLKARGTGVTIATVYYFAKEAGIKLHSETTKTVVRTALFSKRGKRTKKDTIKLLESAEDIPEEISAPIIDQVFEKPIHQADAEETPIEELEAWLRQNYTFERNEITRYIEMNGKIMEQKDFNTVFIEASKQVSKVNYQTLERLVNSDFTPGVNPITHWFEGNSEETPTGYIDKLLSTIKTDTGTNVNYLNHFGKKWIVSIVASAFDKHSPLMFVLSGGQRTGKTEWFRRLLPKELKPYYAESKLDAGKDDEILMTQKLIIMDDEMGGKSKKESRRLKELTSKQVFSLREPYGRNNVDLKRLAVLCGTSNDEQVLNDPTGNRRIIPVNVLSIDHKAYNAIDKTKVFQEAYHLFGNEFPYELSAEDVELLNDATSFFEETSPEYDLITKFFSLPQTGNPFNHFYSTTEIKALIEKETQQRLNIRRLGAELKRIGFRRYKKSERNIKKWGYDVLLKHQRHDVYDKKEDEEFKDELPF